MVALGLVLRSALAAPLVDAIGVDVGNHSIAMPFDHLERTTPFYPAGNVSAEHRWIDGGVFDLAQVGRLGGFHHGLMGTSLTLGTDLAARLSAPTLGPLAELNLGIGAFDTWRSRPVLAWNEETTTWESAQDPGRPGFMAGFGLGVGYDLAAVSDIPLAFTAQYRWFVQTPFLPALPLGPQGTVSLGVRYTFGAST